MHATINALHSLKEGYSDTFNTHNTGTMTYHAIDNNTDNESYGMSKQSLLVS